MIKDIYFSLINNKKASTVNKLKHFGTRDNFEDIEHINHLIAVKQFQNNLKGMIIHMFM